MNHPEAASLGGARGRVAILKGGAVAADAASRHWRSDTPATACCSTSRSATLAKTGRPRAGTYRRGAPESSCPRDER